MEIKMKKFLLIALATIGLVNNAIAGIYDFAAIYFFNKTSSPIYLIFERNKNSSLCTDNFGLIKTVKPGKKYKFWIFHKQKDPKICHFRLLGATHRGASESTIALQENFTVGLKRKFLSRGDTSSHIHSHETQPSKCGLGMTCSTHLANDTKSLYITAYNQENQYAHIIFHNNRPEISYVKFDHLKGPCSSYIKHSQWFKVSPEDELVGYIHNSFDILPAINGKDA
jgi:hypothetical protein